MHDQLDDERLSRISTQWSLIYQAHWGRTDAAAAAQCHFVQRYCGAVYRYLLGALRDEDAAEMAEQLAADGGKPMTAGHVRVLLHRARERFSDLLVQEVAHSLGRPAPDELLRELRDLSLLSLCEASYRRWRATQDPPDA